MEISEVKKENTPGCSSCGTGSCNKLNVYDWLGDMELPSGQMPYNVVEVRFKGTRKEYYRNTDYHILKVGDMVAVEGNPGHDIGEVSLTGELVKLQLKKHGIGFDSVEIKQLYRPAKPADIEKWKQMRDLEGRTMFRSREIAIALGLKMKLSDVEYQGDGKKAIFYYTAEERVDFRELIRKLADEFKVRIEMKQIGLRQEAGRLGGIGSCGRELCCSSWLTEFKTVNTAAARYQNLSINPVKLAGQCGKLKCCLNYELDSYLDALKDIPESSVSLQTEAGVAFHRKTDIFKRMMWYELMPKLKEGEYYHPSADKWVMMPVDRVKEIIAMNVANQKPVDLKSGLPEIEEEEEPDYSDVVGQDSLTRMDNKKKKKKKNNNRNKPQGESRSQNAGTQITAGPKNENKPQNMNTPANNQRNDNKPRNENPQRNSNQQSNNQNRNKNQDRNNNRPQNNNKSQNNPNLQQNNPAPQNTNPPRENLARTRVVPPDSNKPANSNSSGNDKPA